MSCDGLQVLNPICQVGQAITGGVAGAADSAFSHIAGYFGAAALSTTTWLWDQIDSATSLDLSTSADLRLPLRWTALLRGTVDADLALSGGVHTPADAVKALLVGATAVMTTSSVLRQGPTSITRLRDGLAGWLEEKGYHSVDQLRGSMAVGNVPDPDAYERANYLRVIQEANRRYGLTID